MSESCTVRKVGELKINGVSDKIKIIGLDYSLGDMKQSASVSATILDKEGFLQDFPLSVNNPMEITIGSINFLGYPISESRDCSPDGSNIIEVEFVDGSFILDKILVGLWGQHWPVQTRTINISGNQIKSKNRGAFYGSDPIIIVGTFVDPCGDEEIDVVVDPCDPCLKSPLSIIEAQEEEMKKIDCEKLRDLKILECDYTFRDLLDAINLGWAPINVSVWPDFDGIDKYRASYTGTLRDVLNNWCRDFGWGYYWEDGKIKILDLKGGILINLKGMDLSCDVTKISKKRSLDGTYANNIFGHFFREGQERNYRCQYEFGKRIVCRPLCLKDLLNPSEPMAKMASAYVGVSGGSPNEWALDKYDLVEFLCMCSMYSPRLREAIGWLNAYGIVSAEAANERVEESKSITGIPGVSLDYTSYFSMGFKDDLDLKQSSMPLLDMTIKKVFSSKINPSGYRKIYESLDGDVKALIESESSEDDDYYFFIGHRNDERFSTRYEWEASIGSDFLGKFFIRKYPSNHGNLPRVSAAGGDSSQYYEQGSLGLDFSKFFVTSNPDSYMDELTDSNGATKDSFILVERNPVWIPPNKEGDALDQLIDICEECVPIETTSVLSLNLNEGSWSAEDVKNDHPQVENQSDEIKQNGGWTEYDKIFFVKKYKKSKSGALSVSNLTTYDFHPKEKIQQVEIEGFQTPVKIGLRSTQAKKISIENVIFWMPPQSTSREQEGGGSGHIPYAGGYYVFVNNNNSVESNLRIPAIEIVRAHNYPLDHNVLRNELLTIPLGESALKEYYYDESELGCKVDNGKIELAIDDYVSPLKISQIKPLESISVEINGIPNLDFKVEDGFRGMSVRFYADAPVTTLNFQNSFPIPEEVSVRNEIRKHDPLFSVQEKTRSWRKPPSDYPNEDGYPTI